MCPQEPKCERKNNTAIFGGINDRLDNKEQKCWLLHMKRGDGAWTLQGTLAKTWLSTS